MVLIIALLAAILLVWFGGALAVAQMRGISPRQALLYFPIRLLYRISDDEIRTAQRAEAPVVYVILHQSNLDDMVLLSLLPSETLHILDEGSAGSAWMEPWRGLARTIPFNARHVFISRRLVRHLRGKGRLAVYISDKIERDSKAFNLYRAVGRIARKAEARVVAIAVDGARHSIFSRTPAPNAPRRFLGKLRLTVLAPMTIPELIARGGEDERAGSALFARVAETLNPQSD